MEEIIAMHFSIHAEVRRKGKQNRNLSAAAPRYRLRRPTLVMTMIVFVLTVLLFPKQSVDGANSNDDYYADVDDSVSQGNQDDGSSSNSAATDDANSGYFAANDDVSSASAGDNANANQNSAADDLYVANDDNTSYSSSNSGSDNSYQKEQKQYQNADDDVFHWNANIGFDGVSVMPLSCIN